MTDQTDDAGNGGETAAAPGAALQLDAATLTGDVRRLILDFLKHEKTPLPWDAQSEVAQRETITKITGFAGELVDQVVAIVAAAGLKTIRCTVDDVAFKAKAIAIKLHCDKHDPARHDLADAQGDVVAVAIGAAHQFHGERAPEQVNLDQADLLEGGQADAQDLDKRKPGDDHPDPDAQNLDDPDPEGPET